ncbi:type II secretion system protein GspM [Microbaculum marinum]|uniref:Type II secretion system protein GspM n=1 Tax=Microbaculum marinum TaxID=1764581 RepID=A0AAW9RVZ7_9HYPH
MSASFDSRRFAAVAVLAVLLLAGIIWIVWATLAIGAIEERTEQQRAQLETLSERTRELFASGGADGPETKISVYFAGDTPAIAAAAVQRTVDEIVDDAGGRVVESQILPVEQGADPAHRIDLRASFEADIDAFQAALYNIETHLPMMMIRSMSARSFTGRGAGNAEDENPTLQISLVVSGFWAADEE